MALKIPTYERQVTPGRTSISAPQQPALASPKVVPGAFKDAGAEAFEKLGQLGGKVAERIQQLNLEKQDKARIDKETSFMREMQGMLTDPSDETVTSPSGEQVNRKKGLLLRQLENADGATLEFDRKYMEDVQRRYMKGMTPYQLEKFKPFMERYYLQQRNKIITHEANQYDASQENSIKNNLAQRVLDASTIRDSESLDFAVADAIENAATYYSKYDENTRNVLNEEIARKIIESAATSTLQNTGSLELAEQLLEGSKDMISQTSKDEITSSLSTIAKKNLEENQIATIRSQFNAQKDLDSKLPDMNLPDALRELENGAYSGKYDKKWAESKKRVLLSNVGIDQDRIDEFESDIILKIADITGRYQFQGKGRGKQNWKQAQDYLRGLRNIEVEINDGLAQGLIDNTSAKTQLKKLYDSTTAQATQRAIQGRRFHYDIDDANKDFEKVLLPEDRFRAVRQFFYDTDEQLTGRQLTGEEKKTQAEMIIRNINNPFLNWEEGKVYNTPKGAVKVIGFADNGLPIIEPVNRAESTKEKE